MILRQQLIETYQQTSSLRETARLLGVTRNTVRKWVRRFAQNGDAGLTDQSRRPKCSPRQTPPAIEAQVLARQQATGWGRVRLAQEFGLPEGTVRHILRRHQGQTRRQRRPRHPFLLPLPV